METNIEHNAAEALKVIAAAEKTALQRISDAQTLAAVPFTRPQTQYNDHDALVRLIQSVDDFHEELRRSLNEMKVSLMNITGGHEHRINELESANIKQNTYLGIIIVIGSFLAALLIYHISGIKL